MGLALIKSLNLLRNIGRFDNVTSGAQIPFGKLTVIYAENARGKSTIAAIFRSLATGRADLINERARLGAAHPPHIVVETDVAPHAMFQGGAWNRTMPEVSVFDDAFVAENVCAGIEVGTTQRQNLHELIVGSEGIALARAYQVEVDAIETHNRNLRDMENALPRAARGDLTAEQFCALAPVNDLPRLTDEAEKRLAAAQNSARIAAMGTFGALELPRIDLEALRQTLAAGLPDLDANALRRVQAHLAGLGRGGEAWVGHGLAIADDQVGEAAGQCPLCAQDLADSPLLAHYRAYFSEAYNDFRKEILKSVDDFKVSHSSDIQSAFERRVRETVEKRGFWRPFVDVPEDEIDTAAIALTWKLAREHVERLLETKLANPLEALVVSDEAVGAIAAYNARCDQIAHISDLLLIVNFGLDLVKEEAREANLAVLASDLGHLKAIAARFDPAIAPQCDAYLAERVAKSAAETRRAAARARLDEHRQRAFPAYGIAINQFLQRFNANFRVGPIDPVNNRAGSSANYTLLIDGHAVPLAAADGETSFRNTLSAGDRNTLALAFFFASLENHPDRARKIIVIDDPMTSLDEHRTLHTVQEMDRLVREVAAMIVLSHSKPFLLSVWDKCKQVQKAAVEVRRSEAASTLAKWDVTANMVTEHDRRHADALAYLKNADPDKQRRVAESLRPMLEAFCRVAYPDVFTPSHLLGLFHDKCAQALRTPNPIMDQDSTRELRLLLDYGNRFHHDTNNAYATELISDDELADFTRRTLKFIKRQ